MKRAERNRENYFRGYQAHMKRPGILGEALLNYERPDSRIPDSIRVSFDDGTTAVYTLKCDQPAPILIENIRIIRKWGRDHGYQASGYQASGYQASGYQASGYQAKEKR